MPRLNAYLTMSRLFVTVVCLGALFGSAHAAPTAATTPTVVLTTKVERVGDDPVLFATLENKGAQAVWLYGLLDFESWDCTARPRGSLQISVGDARGRTLRTSCRPLVPNFTKTYHRALMPGERVTASLALASCYQFEKGETIRLAVFYVDPSENGPPAPSGTATLRDRVRATELTFVVP